MSAKELNRTFPKKDAKITEEYLGNAIGKILKNVATKRHGSVKYLTNITNLETRAIYNWCSGVNCPDLLNFIILAKNIPPLFDLFVALCERGDIYKINADKNQKNYYEIINVISGKVYSLIQNEGINIFDDNFRKLPLNYRQKWFLQQLQQGKNIKNKDLVQKYAISAATAERDISQLIKINIIKFTGSKRNGRYIII